MIYKKYHVIMLPLSVDFPLIRSKVTHSKSFYFEKNAVTFYKYLVYFIKRDKLKDFKVLLAKAIPVKKDQWSYSLYFAREYKYKHIQVQYFFDELNNNIEYF